MARSPGLLLLGLACSLLATACGPSTAPAQGNSTGSASSRGGPEAAAGTTDAVGSAGAAADRRPDVLLVVIDTLRADRTGVLQAPADDNTPSLTALGASGITYRQAVSPAAWTLPSMAALLAGHAVAESRRSAFPDEPTLAERFAAGGWHTAALLANPLLARDNGFARGCADFDVAPSSVASLHVDLGLLRAWNAQALGERALALLAAAPHDVPVFLYLHLMDAHVPYDPQNDALAPLQAGWSDPGAPMHAWTEPLTAAQSERLSGWRRAYDGQVRAVDAALGTLLARLPGVRRRPCVVAVTADHGEGLCSHEREADSPSVDGPLGAGYPDHGEQLHEECLRVPLWLAGPGVPSGLDERRPVATSDLAATLLQLAGLPAPGPRLPLGPQDPVPALICGVGTRGWFARSATRKLIEPFPERLPHAGIARRLFAVQADALAPEREDLAPNEPQALAGLADALHAWRSAAVSRQPEAPDPATEERLRAIGYVR